MKDKTENGFFELNALKEEVETLNNKLKELTDEELAHVTGGVSDGDKVGVCPICGTPTKVEEITLFENIKIQYEFCSNCGWIKYN